MEQSETKQISWEQFVSSANTLVRVSETTEPEMWCRRTYSVSVTPLGINMKHTEHTKKKAHTHLCMGWISFVSMLNSASTRQNRFCSAGYLDSDSVVWASLSLCVFQALFFFLSLACSPPNSSWGITATTNSITLFEALSMRFHTTLIRVLLPSTLCLLVLSMSSLLHVHRTLCALGGVQTSKWATNGASIWPKQ